ncbi:thiol reductant ABC exporter subunit CydD [Lysinibacter sp. HNR]|uniref:thiol reductant ABC exporter subunit CydD n=1 Tax=Lysinibacter sp. HNR TaxID=3031408 RepID=UPI002434F9FD|nr:thiol reductant ABC exporter subunit CydD [Lysinibacter sp. HNR]WGD36418.1 thiol reductant ABC exporter subunit CydD [Lysinibacter sp. HNR]
MKPFDVRLLSYARSIRWVLARSVLIGLLRVASLVGFAWFTAQVVVGVVSGTDWDSLALNLAGLAGAVAIRALTVWLSEANSARGASEVKSELRRASLEAVHRLGPSWLAGRSSASVTTSLTQGLDALDEYFAKYLPQLIMTALATPILVIIIWVQDWTSAVVILVAYPVIPIFMILIGLATQSVQKKQWEALGSLASSFLDVVKGISTLKIFGRAERQAARIESVTEDYRKRTMKVLRITFLSGFVLDLAGTLSVAFVAVAIGLRLVEGTMLLSVGLFVLLLVPEVFLPIRQVGASFHAAAEGLTAVEDIFEILEGEQAARVTDRVETGRDGNMTGRDGNVTGRDGNEANTPVVKYAGKSPLLELRDVSVSYGEHTAVSELNLRASGGEIVALVGPSGVGKSSVLGSITGLVPHAGSVLVSGSPVDSQAAGVRTWLSWAGQQPGLVAGTVAENIALGSGVPDGAAVVAALETAAALEIDPGLRLGSAGEGLSGGQAQRVAIARAVYRLRSRGSRVLLLDEPTSAVDSVTESSIMDALEKLAATGIAIVIVSHRASVIDRAHTIVRMTDRVAA